MASTDPSAVTAGPAGIDERSVDSPDTPDTGVAAVVPTGPTLICLFSADMRRLTVTVFGKTVTLTDES